MAHSTGRVGLMVLAVLVPCMVFIGVANSGRGTSGATSKAAGGTGRRLQTSGYEFATQLEMTVCLTEDHSTDSASSSAEEFKLAVMDWFDLTDGDLVKVDETVAECAVDNWQRRVSIYNTADGTSTAADIASAQVDLTYPEPKTSEFFDAVAVYINSQNSELEFAGSDFDLYNLGFLVIWLDSSGDVVESQGTTTSKNVVSIGGMDVWWPWWAWLIYAAVVLCCICPMLFFFFKWRRDKEAELDSYGIGSGKNMGAPAPPSATSSNPYGGNYGAEEHKSGK